MRKTRKGKKKDSDVCLSGRDELFIFRKLCKGLFILRSRSEWPAMLGDGSAMRAMQGVLCKACYARRDVQGVLCAACL